MLETAKQIADRNIERSKVLMEPLRLMNSGYYQGEELKEYEFRDDTQDYTAFIQRKFLQWHERGLAYFDNTADTPQFYLDIDKLYEQRPLAQISDGLSASKSAIRIFSNNYRNYTKDLPITAAGGYAIPVPIRVDNRGNLEPIDVSSDPVDPRTEGINQNHLLTIKPLIGCYVFIEYLADRFGDFDTVAISNDYHMATRVNFVSLLLGDKRYRNMRMIHFNLFLDEEGRVYSFKRGVVQDIDDLEKLGSGFARFTLVKNTKLGFSNNQVDFDIASFQKIQKILHESEGGDNFDDVVESKMLKRQVSISEFTARCVESGDISRAVNFLSDVLFQHPNNSVAKYYLNLFI